MVIVLSDYFPNLVLVRGRESKTWDLLSKPISWIPRKSLYLEYLKYVFIRINFMIISFTTGKPAYMTLAHRSLCDSNEVSLISIIFIFWQHIAQSIIVQGLLVTTINKIIDSKDMHFISSPRMTFSRN